MVRPATLEIAQRAQALYEQGLRRRLEQTDFNRYVAIEPDSGDFYLGDSLSEAIFAARKAHPESISFAIRIGHDSAVHLGGASFERAD